MCRLNFCLCIFSFVFLISEGRKLGSPQIDSHETKKGYKLKVTTLTDSYSVNLKRPEESIISNTFYVLTLGANDNGETVYKKWVPTEEEKQSANDLYIDERKKAVLRVKKNHESSQLQLSGTLSDMAVTHDGYSHVMNYMDLVPSRDSNEKVIPDVPTAGATKSVKNIVELVLVCDKDVSALFDFNEKKLLDYYTIALWDVNLRYKTLPSVDMSIRLNGIVVISNDTAQPFIEDTRDSSGKADMVQMLNNFGKWMYSQRDLIPKHDHAQLQYNTETVQIGVGLAWIGEICQSNEGEERGVSISTETDGWTHVTSMTHEMGHNFGANHDAEIKDCNQTGFIMSGGTYFFSSCSDKAISEYVLSEKGSCLRRIDGEGEPAVDSSFSNPKAPSFTEICKRFTKNNKAWAEDLSTCDRLWCRTPKVDNGDGVNYESSLTWAFDNAICDNNDGRCFRGKCRKGYLLRNEGSGLCLIAPDPFNFSTVVQMMDCPSDKDVTPLHRFEMNNNKGSSGITFGTPFSYDRNEENGDKCLRVGSSKGSSLSTDRCSGNDSSQLWKSGQVNKRFVLTHQASGRCAKPKSKKVGSEVEMVTQCDKTNKDVLWTLN